MHPNGEEIVGMPYYLGHTLFGHKETFPLPIKKNFFGLTTFKNKKKKKYQKLQYINNNNHRIKKAT